MKYTFIFFKKTFTLFFLGLFTNIAFANNLPTIEFAGVKDNYPHIGEQTWYYIVESGAKPSVSHIAFELCQGEYEVIGGGNWGANFEELIPQNESYVQIGEDPTTGIIGIKFETSLEDGEKAKVYFTIDRLMEATLINYAIKSGQDIKYDSVTGPSCNTIVTPTPSPCGPIYKDPAIIKWSPKIELKHGEGMVYFSIHGQVIPCNGDYDFIEDNFKAQLKNLIDGEILSVEVPPGALVPKNNKAWKYKSSRINVSIKRKIVMDHVTYAFKVKAYTPLILMTSTNDIQASIHFGDEYHFLEGDWLGLIGKKVKLPNKYFKKIKDLNYIFK